MEEEEEDWKEDWELLEGHLGLLPDPGLPSATVASDPLSSSNHSRAMKPWPSLLLLSWPFLRGRCMGGAGRRPAGGTRARLCRWPVRTSSFIHRELKARAAPRAQLCPGLRVAGVRYLLFRFRFRFGFGCRDGAPHKPLGSWSLAREL